jgi:transposase
MYVGFDVSKARVDYALVNRAGRKVLCGTCDNTTEAVGEILCSIQKKHPSCQAIVESTGAYQQYVTATCHEQGVVCRLLNPIQTKQFTRSTVRKTKTDTKDAYHIALLGLQGAGGAIALSHNI